MANEPLSLKVKLGFGVCDLGGNLFFTVTAFMLPNFLTDTVGLGAGLAGFALMIGRIWDSAVDPLVGYASDHTTSRWGRRRPYMLFAALPLWLAMAIMFTAPGFKSQHQLFAWATVAYCLLFSIYSLINIPYSALTPELTSDFNERTVLNGYRMTFAVVGSLVGAGAALPLASAFSSRVVGFSMMGIIFGAVMAVTALITVFTVREPATRPEVSTTGLLASYREAFKNRPFVIVLAAWILHTTAITVLGGMMVYYFKYIFREEKLTTFALLILLVIAMAFIPVWVKLSKRWGKKACSMLGMVIISTALLAVFLFGESLGVKFFFGLMFLAGMGLSTQYIFPYATIPDVVEYDFAQTGQRKEGVYYAVWTFTAKLGQALAGVGIGWILSACGYVPDVAQGPWALWGIRFLFGPIAIALYVAAAIVLSFYPLSREKYDELMATIRARELGAAVETPPAALGT